MPETEEDRRLWQRLEAGRRRVAEARARGECEEPPPADSVPDAGHRRKAISGRTIIERLQRGRQRARSVQLQREAAARGNNSDSPQALVATDIDK